MEDKFPAFPSVGQSTSEVIGAEALQKIGVCPVFIRYLSGLGPGFCLTSPSAPERIKNTLYPNGV